MTREEAKAKLPIIKAFIEGKKIQVFDDEKGWVETEYLLFNLSPNYYRIKPEPKKFDPKTLKPFDKVLAKSYGFGWRVDFFSNYNDSVAYPYMCIGNAYQCCIPYNYETKHLVGTYEEAPEYYRYWED